MRIKRVLYMVVGREKTALHRVIHASVPAKGGQAYVPDLLLGSQNVKERLFKVDTRYKCAPGGDSQKKLNVFFEISSIFSKFLRLTGESHHMP